MTFLEPVRLWLLLAVAGLAAAYVLAQRRRVAYAVRFTDLALLDRVAPRRPGWRRHASAAAFLAMLLLLVTGFARPTAPQQVPRERATVMLVLDTSASMEASDVAPSRDEAARAAAMQFAEALPERVNLGLVSFSDVARQVAAPTTDREVVRRGIERLQLGPRTAIGEGVFTALDGIRAFDSSLARGADRSDEADEEGSADDGERPESVPAPARIVLLSDGGNTAGREVAEASTAASAAGVAVSTIAYGTPDGSVTIDGRQVRVPVDGPTLEGLAEQTGGSYYEAASGEELNEVYDDIGSAVGYETEQREVSTWFIGLGLIAALAAAAASLRWFARLP